MEKTFRGIKKASINEADVIFTGLAVDKNASNVDGTKYEPKRFRELSYVVTPFAMDGTSIEDVKLCDTGDIKDFNKIEERAREVFSHDGFPFFLGGDHSVAIPTEKVFIEKCLANKQTPVVIHIDAHADIMSIYQNNPFSHATPNYHALKNGLKDENLTMLAIRSYEDIEVSFLKEHNNIKVYGMDEIWDKGIAKIVDELTKKYKKNGYKIYLSLDIDSLDPSYAPGTGTPEAFGLTSRELNNLILGIFKNLDVAAMDIVEISPTADCNDITSYVGIKLFYEILKLIGGKK